MEVCRLYLKAGLPLFLAAAAVGLFQSSAAAIDRGRRDVRAVALTFDGGGDAGESDLILSVLEERGVPATFFLTGEYIRRYPERVLRIAGGGHEVGNHTWSHPHLTAWERTHRQDTLAGVDRARLGGELLSTARAYEDLTGLAMAPLWRAPYGECNDELERWAGEDGWTHVGWTRDDRGRRTLDSLDWVADRGSRLYLSSAHIVERILSFGSGADGLNGGIVLMHLSGRREDPGAARLAELVDALRAGGYRFVTVSRLLEEAGDPLPPLLATAALAGFPGVGRH